MGLAGGGGVDGAIHRAGGAEIARECAAIIQRIGRLPTGDAVATGGGNLPAKRVIHAVGPRYRAGWTEAPQLLGGAYRRGLEIAVEEGLRSIAFPSISTGIYGYPIGEAARVALSAVRAFLLERGAPAEVTFCLFSDADLEAYRRALEELRR